MSFKRKGSTRRVYNPNKMDTTRAQGILGFTSNRWMDTSAGGDPKEVLDQALAAQMQKAAMKKVPKEKVLLWNNKKDTSGQFYQHFMRGFCAKKYKSKMFTQKSSVWNFCTKQRVNCRWNWR